MSTNIEKKILSTISSEKVLGKDLIQELKELPIIKLLYSQQLYGRDNLTLEEHTLRVIETFELYFEGRIKLILTDNYFKLLLAFHDLGKPNAIIGNEYEKQHEHTLLIIREISKTVHFQEEVMLMITTIINGDPIGRFLNKKHSSNVEIAYNKIRGMADNLNISIIEMWINLLVYFQCDASGYDSLLKKVFITDSSNQLVFSTEHKRFLLKDPDEMRKFEKLEGLIFHGLTGN